MRVAHYQGLDIPNHKDQTRNIGISSIPASSQLVLPLNQHHDTLLIPCVIPGQRVLAGQAIAKPAHRLGASLHAPVSGLVRAIEPCATATSQKNTTPSIVLSNDTLAPSVTHSSTTPHWHSLSSITLCEQLASGGIVGLGGAVFPVATKLAAHTQHPINQLIINGVECEPYISCDDHLMQEHATEILQGTKIMMHACQTSSAIIAIEADKPEAIAAIGNRLHELNDNRIRVQVIPSTYPSGDEGQLIRHLTGQEIPHGKLPAHIGIIVSNVATVYASARWILHGEPLISRIVTVSGNGISKPGNYRVLLGTSMQDVLRHCGAVFKPGQRLIMGGAMMGHALDHTGYPVIKATNALILADDQELNPVVVEQACIRCGACAEACPVHLLPQQLLSHARHGHKKAFQQLGLYDCIECGNCDYVCPSHIRLVTHFRRAKQVT